MPFEWKSGAGKGAVSVFGDLERRVLEALWERPSPPAPGPADLAETLVFVARLSPPGHLGLVHDLRPVLIRADPGYWSSGTENGFFGYRRAS